MIKYYKELENPKEFYEILNAIQKKRSKKKNGKETHHEAAH